MKKESVIFHVLVGLCIYIYIYISHSGTRFCSNLEKSQYFDCRFSQQAGKMSST